jgi:hypothetical protein
MAPGQDRRGARLNSAAVAPIAISAALAFSATALSAASWCLGFGALGPVRAGMSVEEVLRLADFSGLERKQAADECWYLHYEGSRGADFDLMIIGDRVVRIELRRDSTLSTLSGARIGSSEAQLERWYGARLEKQPHKYDAQGHTLTYRSADGGQGLRFETSAGKVTAIQSGPWEHLHYVEGCS